MREPHSHPPFCQGGASSDLSGTWWGGAFRGKGERRDRFRREGGAPSGGEGWGGDMVQGGAFMCKGGMAGIEVVQRGRGGR